MMNKSDDFKQDAMLKQIMLDQIKVVLVHTSHPGNIGSAARAMKTMGLNDLCLVSPKSFPDVQANTMASSAEDLLQKATVVESLPDAIADCQLVIGTSARSMRSLSWSVFEPRKCGEVVAEEITNNKKAKVALVFGRERTGLTNEELSFCHHLVHIPTNPDYSSLNVASAVQILAYECRVSVLAENVGNKSTVNKSMANEADVEEEQGEEIVTSKDMQGYYDHLEKLMIETEFLDPKEPRLLMSRLRRLYGRLQISRSEMNILRGMLVAFSKRMGT